MKNRVLASILAIVLVLGLAGCGGTGNVTEGTTASEGTTAAPQTEESVTAATDKAEDDKVSAHIAEFNLASDRDPTDMGPWAGNMGGASAQINLCYQALQIKELNGELEPSLAKSIEKTGDFDYTVELFDYIKDSDGNPFTANDVKFSVETAISLGKQQSAKMIESVDVIDDTHCIIHFKDSIRVGDVDGAFSQLWMVTQKAYESEGNGMAQHPIGTGPYIMSNYVGGSVITFTANKDYWQTDEQYIARSAEQHADVINFKIVTEATQRALAIEDGSLDYASVSLNDKARLESEGYEMVPIPDNLTYMLFINMDSASVCSVNKDLREALFYAISNESVSTLYTSASSVPVYDISNSNYPDYYEEEYKAEDNYYKYDIDKAQELLGSSGFDTSQELKLLCSSDAASIEIAEILKSLWEALGVTVSIDSYQGNLMSQVAGDPNNWDIYLLQYASTDYAVNVWEKVLNKHKYAWEGTINFVLDDELQQKLLDVRSEDGHTKENVIAFHDYIVEGAWAKGLIQGVQYYAISDKLTPENVIFSEQRLIRPNASIFVEK